MLLEEVIAERRDELTVSDRRLIDVLLLDKTEGSFLPAHEIAERARRPSLHGGAPRPQARLRILPRHARGASQRGAVRPRRLEARAQARGPGGGPDVAPVCHRGEIRALSALASQVDQATLDRTTQWLGAARRIFVMGEGHAGSLAEIFARRLKRSGYQACRTRPHGLGGRR